MRPSAGLARLRPPADRAGLIHARERGFTLVEVMVASAILLAGVLGTIALVDGANARTAATKTREGATNLARELVEAARAAPYRQVTQGSLAGQLQARPGLADSDAASGWTLARRGAEYAIRVSVCSLDDPADGLGDHSGGAFCADAQPAGSADGNPEDYKRVVFDLSWSVGAQRHSLRQVTLATPRGTGDLPAVKSLELSSPPSEPITSPAVSAASFTVGTAGPTETVSWSVDGVAQGVAGGGNVAWSFVWPLDVVDGSYDVAAHALDPNGLSGPSRSLTVTLNRYAPDAPEHFNAGRNTPGVVEAEWSANSERDIVGYRVYRESSSGAATLACPLQTATSCIDLNAPGSAGAYWVVAVDRDPAGSLREGAESTRIDVSVANEAPSPPADLAATTTADGSTVLSWVAPSPADPDAGDSIDSFRIYRDGESFADRYDRTPLGTDTSYTDEATGGTTHTYHVTAVDTHLKESILAGPVTG